MKQEQTTDTLLEEQHKKHEFVGIQKECNQWSSMFMTIHGNQCKTDSSQLPKMVLLCEQVERWYL